MADEIKTSQMPSKDANPINIKRKDEVFLDVVDVLGTEGVANQHAGRKPGRGSKRLSKLEAETGLMYRSDSMPRLTSCWVHCLRHQQRDEGQRVCYRLLVLSFMDPPAQEFYQVQVSTLLQSSHFQMSRYLQVSHKIEM